MAKILVNKVSWDTKIVGGITGENGENRAQTQCND